MSTLANPKVPATSDIHIEAASAAPDFVTILECEPGRRATKLFRNDAQKKPHDYDAGEVFRATEYQVTSLADLRQLLDIVRGDPTRFVIAGRLKSDVPIEEGSTGWINRRKHDRGEHAGAFEEASHHWLCLDIDNTATRTLPELRATLPDGMRDAEAIWLPSSNAHRFETLRGKLFVWLDRAIGETEAIAICKSLGADESVMRTVQPIFVADPIFEGCDDPLPSRAPEVLPGGVAMVPKLPPSAANKPAAGKRARSTPERRIERARTVVGQLPASIAGDGGDDQLFKVACAAAAEIGRNVDAIEMVLNEFNERCVPPWEAKTIRRAAARSAEKSGGLANIKDAFSRDRKAPDAPANDIDAPETAEPHPLGRERNYSKPAADPRWLVKDLGIGWVGKACGVVGYAGTGKGPFLSMLAICVASGKPFLRREVKRVPVLYLDRETGESLLDERHDRIAHALGVDLVELQRDGWIRTFDVGGQLVALLDDIEAAAKALDKGDGVAIMLDSYSSLHGGDQNAGEYADPLWALGMLGKHANAVPIVVMHQRKGDRNGSSGGLESLSGTNQLAAALATAIELSRDPKGDRTRMKVSCARAPKGDFKPFEIEWRDPDRGKGLIAEPTGIANPTDKDAAKQAEGRATVAKNALRIARLVYEKTGPEGGTTVRAVRDELGLGGPSWGSAYDLAKKKYGIESTHFTGKPRLTCEREPPKEPSLVATLLARPGK